MIGAVQKGSLEDGEITSRLAAPLLSLVVLRAVGNCVGGEIGNTNIRPILVTRSIRVGGSECDNNREVSCGERSKLLITNDPIRAKGAANSVIKVGGRDSGTDDGFRSTSKGVLGFGIEPTIGLGKRIVTQENTAISANPGSRGFPRVSAVKVNEDCLVRLELAGNRVDRYMWPLVLIEQGQSRSPLKIGNDDATQRDERSNSSQKNHPPVESRSAFNIGHSLFELVMALDILAYTHSQLIGKWNLRALFLLITLYLIASGLIFHELGRPAVFFEYTGIQAVSALIG